MTTVGNFKCCSKLFCVITFIKTSLIITAVYVLLNSYFNDEGNRISVQPVARGLKNWTFGYIRKYFIGTNLTRELVGNHRKSAQAFNFTKTIRKRVKKRRKRRNGKKEVIIFVGIISAPQLIFRRNALRRSWLKWCREKGIPCLFFTDSQDMHGNKLPLHIHVPLHQEQLLHGDLILAESPGGVNFARRYLWVLNWANARYKFKYFLRVDDDYFVCIDRLFLELPHRPRKKLYWGHVHCSPPGRILILCPWQWNWKNCTNLINWLIKKNLFLGFNRVICKHNFTHVRVNRCDLS